MTTTKKRAARALDTAADSPMPAEIEIPGTGIKMPGFRPKHPLAPPERPYIFGQRLVEDVATSARLGLNVMLTGPTGCGKTSLIGAIASVLGRPVVRFNCDGETRVSNLRGMQKPAAKDGVLTLVFSPGDLAIAMENGYWVILDEVDAALPSVLMTLHPVLEEDRREMHIPETKKTVRAHADFRVFATGNTVGYRAVARSRHAGTNPLNAAFIDRFGMVIACDYPTPEEEHEIVRAHLPELHPMLIEAIVRTAAELRKDGNFRADFSTRRVLHWARLTEAYSGDLMRAAELTIIRKLENATDAKVAKETIARKCGYEEKA